MWPWRTEDNNFFLLESQTHRYVALDKAGFLHPLALRHFYDGFSLRAEVSIRSAALVAFDLQEDELSSDLILSLFFLLRSRTSGEALSVIEV